MAFGAANNLAAKAMDDDGFNSLGLYTSSALYIVFGIGSFLSSAIVHKLGTRASLAISSVFYAIYIVCFILPAKYAENKEQ